MDSADQSADTPRRYWRPSSLPALGDEEGWLCGTTFYDRLIWQQDADAARLLGERYRSGCRDVEELQYDLEQIAFLDPAEAQVCLDWLRAEEVSAEWSHSFPNGSTVGWSQFVSQLAGKVASGERIRQLAAAPFPLRGERLQEVRELVAGTPEWWEGAREVILAEALVDPARAAELALELWNQRGYADPHGEQEVVRRLWLRDPWAALSYLDCQKCLHGSSLLPIFLQGTLSAPSAEHRRLAVNLLARMDRCSGVTLCIAVARVLRSLEAWGLEDRSALVEAAVQAVLQFDPVYDDPRARHARFKEELAAHLPALQIPREQTDRLSAELRGAASQGTGVEG